MERPEFSTRKEARAWLVSGAIEDAVAPFLGVLPGFMTQALRDYLEDTAETHPVIRLLATRAAVTFAPREVPPLKVAARLADDEEAGEADEPTGKTAKVKEVRRDRAIVGKPKLTREDYEALTLRVMRPLAKRVARRAGRGKDDDFIDDLVGHGWMVAVEIESDWDRTKALYSTYLWCCVRRRLINHAKLHMNVFERPASSVFASGLNAKDAEDGRDAEEAFQWAMDNAAGAWVLGFLALPPETPEGLVADALDRDALDREIEKLASDQKEIVTIVFREGLSIDDAAKRLGLSEGTARRRVESAIPALRRALGESSNVVPLRGRSSRKE